MTWDGIVQAPRWKCGHPRTPENTYKADRQGAKCLICKRAYARDYLEREHEPPEAEEDAPIEGDESLTEEDLAQWARSELKRLGATGIVGDEFERARQRHERRGRP